MALLNEDRLFPAEERTRTIAKRLYAGIRYLPIVSPHGHTQAGWFVHNQPFPDPVALFVQPDHYAFRMLYSQGISFAAHPRDSGWISLFRSFSDSPRGCPRPPQIATTM